MSLQEQLIRSRTARTALAVVVNGKHLRQPQLSELAWHLHALDEKRNLEKCKPMSDEHMMQEAVKWARMQR